MTLTRKDAADYIATETGLTKKDARAAIDAYENFITASLADGNDVSFVGFGSYHVKERAERKGRNPQTGEEITIAASKVPSFKAGKAFKNAIK